MSNHAQTSPAEGGEIRVAVVDDHTTFSELLSLALANEPGVRCVGTAVDATSGAALVEHERPDVVVMDVQLGRDDGIELTADLTWKLPELRVVVLTARTDAQLIQRAAAAGACSLLPKDGSFKEVLQAIRSAKPGGLAVHPLLLKRLVTIPAQAQRLLPELTQREREVLGLLSEGVAVRAIARSLSISEHTCRGHIKRLLVKLDAHSQLEAVAVANRNGLL